MSLKVIPLILLLSPWIAGQSYKNLRTVFEWRSLEFEFPTDNDLQYAVDNGLYQQNAGVPIDIDVEYKPTGHMRFFHTIPRINNGIPFTLATVTKRSTLNGPILVPYPNYHWHNVKNAKCQGITSAFRTVIDDCQQLWVLDSGVENDIQMCPPQLLTFDLRNDSLIRRFQFPPNLYSSSDTIFVTIAVDIRDPPPFGSCRNAMVYAADIHCGGLVVYSSERNRAWRIEDPVMLPLQAWADHSIAGETFELRNGIISLNVSPREERTRYLFFHSYADDREYSVPLRYIDNPSSANNKRSGEFKEIGSRGVQSAIEAIDSKGNIFTSTNDPLSIFAWNINTPYNSRSFKVVADNPDQLQFVSGMKVIKSPFGDDQLWVVTSSYQKIAGRTINYNHVNFKVLFCLTEDLLANGRCTDTVNGPFTEWIVDNSSPKRYFPGRESPRGRF